MCVPLPPFAPYVFLHRILAHYSSPPLSGSPARHSARFPPSFIHVPFSPNVVGVEQSQIDHEEAERKCLAHRSSAKQTVTVSSCWECEFFFFLFLGSLKKKSIIVDYMCRLKLNLWIWFLSINFLVFALHIAVLKLIIKHNKNRI